VIHYYEGEGYNIQFIIESVDGEIIQEDNQDGNENPGDQEKKSDDNTRKGDSENNDPPLPPDDAANKGNTN
jgi:hypothetical protein